MGKSQLRHKSAPLSRRNARIKKWILCIAGSGVLTVLILLGLKLGDKPINNTIPQKPNTVKTLSSIKRYGPSHGTLNGHEWVDLGLPSGTKWATKNVGANKPEEFGDLYSWGETSTKTSYTDTNCITYRKDFATLLKEKIVDADANLTKDYDAASANWGSTWRIPTDEEFKELMDLCKWEFTELNGISGYLVTGPNKESIFIVAAGYGIGETIVDNEDLGDYWTSTSAKDLNRVSYSLGFSPKSYGRRCYARYRGRSIRPITR